MAGLRSQFFALLRIMSLLGLRASVPVTILDIKARWFWRNLAQVSRLKNSNQFAAEIRTFSLPRASMRAGKGSRQCKGRDGKVKTDHHYYKLRVNPYQFVNI